MKTLNFYDSKIEIISEATDFAEFKCHIGLQNIFFDGHFPLKPIFPAVGQMRLIEHLLSSWNYSSCKVNEISKSRFLNVILPASIINLKIEKLNENSYCWQFFDHTKIFSRGNFIIEKIFE